jgi:hypothetical protein
MKANNILPKKNQDYFSVTLDGKIIRMYNTFSKVDLFNIMFSLCWDSRFISPDELNHAKETLKKIIEQNQGETIK